MSESNKPGIIFWIIGVVALIWNSMGVLAYLGQAYMTDEALAAMPQADQDYFNNLPAWVTAAFAIGVFAGALGCVGLLMRKKWAVSLFGLSLLGVLAQNAYAFFMQDYVELTGARMAMPIMVIIISVFLVLYSKNRKEAGVLN